MVSQTYKQKAERPDFTAVVVDPGWVKTSKPVVFNLIPAKYHTDQNHDHSLGW